MSLLFDVIADLPEGNALCQTCYNSADSASATTTAMNKSADQKAWQVLVWGSALAGADFKNHPDDWAIDKYGYFFATREAAEKCAARKVSEGWDSKSIEVVEVDAPPRPPALGCLPSQVHVGPRGGVYTDDVTADGRPYRRYF